MNMGVFLDWELACIKLISTRPSRARDLKILIIISIPHAHLPLELEPTTIIIMYPPIQPYETGTLQVSELHKL